MPYCPVCRAEYDSGRAVCSDCNVDLVESLPSEESEEPVVVYHAATGDEARIAEATLESEGIPAFVQPPDILLPQYSNVVDDDNPELDVMVPTDLADEATAVLREPPVSEEELAAAAESDPRDASDGEVD